MDLIPRYFSRLNMIFGPSELITVLNLSFHQQLYIVLNIRFLRKIDSWNTVLKEIVEAANLNILRTDWEATSQI